MAASRTALRALILRDLVVLRKHFGEFVIRTIVQPFLLVFVFLYVFPSIGQGVGAGGAKSPSRTSRPCSCRAWWRSRSCSRASRPSRCRVNRVRLHARDRGPRASALPDLAGRVSKVLSGAVQGPLAALIVFPIAAVVHAPGVHAHLIGPLADRDHRDSACLHHDELAWVAAGHHRSSPATSA